LGFLEKDIEFILKIFWPHRSDAKGFSIENLAIKYRERISSVSSNKIPKQLIDDVNLKSPKEDSKKVALSNLSIKRGHWANRDFSEYRKAA
tara:strand:- start:523 stop:795 length:273 start_codon:yes stop_codon:yes gene_type:complete